MSICAFNILQLESDNRFAVVKYKDDLDAEATLEKRNGHVIENWRITVSFCAPGVSMEDLCNEAGSALVSWMKNCLIFTCFR